MESKKDNPEFKVEYFSVPDDLDELATSYWTAWANPAQAVAKLTFPHLGENSTAEKEALEGFKRKIRRTVAGKDTNDHWVKVVDRETGKIAGGGRWKQYTENPYRGPMEKYKAVQFPEGSEKRELAEAMYEQLYAYRPKMMAVAHALGLALWVLPEYRQRNIGEVFFKWFTERVDELGLEAYLEGTQMGSNLYKRLGFVTIDRVNFQFIPSKANPSDEWKEIVHELKSEPVYIMWRPPFGIYEEGKTVIPWEGKPRSSKL